MDAWVKIEDQLHKVMDVLEPVRAAFQQYEKQAPETQQRLTSMEQAWKDLVTRLDDLDRRLPVGGKVYLPAFGAERVKGRAMIENFVADIARMRYGREPKTFNRKDMRYSVDGAVARADQTEGTTTAGGFLVPEEVLPEVIALIGEVGVARRICRIIPMMRKDMKVPTRNTGPLVYWPGEGVKPTTSNVALLRPELNSKTMVALDEISEELDMDSIVPMTPLLTDLFVEAVALEEDVQLFSSTTPFSGVLQTTSVVDVTLPVTKTAQSDVAYNDIVSLAFAPDVRANAAGVFVFHRDQVQNILKIKDTAGNPIWKDAPTGSALAAGPAGMLLGRPYYTTRGMPASTNSGAGRYFMCYGDFRYWGFGDRMSMQIDLSVPGGVGFLEFTQWFRVVERIALISLIPTAFARLKTANN